MTIGDTVKEALHVLRESYNPDYFIKNKDYVPQSRLYVTAMMDGATVLNVLEHIREAPLLTGLLAVGASAFFHVTTRNETERQKRREREDIEVLVKTGIRDANTPNARFARPNEEEMGKLHTMVTTQYDEFCRRIGLDEKTIQELLQRNNYLNIQKGTQTSKDMPNSS